MSYSLRPSSAADCGVALKSRQRENCHVILNHVILNQEHTDCLWIDFFFQTYPVRLGEQPPKVPGEDLGIKMRVEKVNTTPPTHPAGTWIWIRNVLVTSLRPSPLGQRSKTNQFGHQTLQAFHHLKKSPDICIYIMLLPFQQFIFLTADFAFLLSCDA